MACTAAAFFIPPLPGLFFTTENDAGNGTSATGTVSGAATGATLSEFSDFFDDPQRQRLKDWQVFVFSAFVIIGWVLGLFLVAAMTGLTQHS